MAAFKGNGYWDIILQERLFNQIETKNFQKGTLKSKCEMIKHIIHQIERSKQNFKNCIMKQIKSFRISEENIKLLKLYSEEQDRSESWIINQLIYLYLDREIFKSKIKPN